MGVSNIERHAACAAINPSVGKADVARRTRQSFCRICDISLTKGIAPCTGAPKLAQVSLEKLDGYPFADKGALESWVKI